MLNLKLKLTLNLHFKLILKRNTGLEFNLKRNVNLDVMYSLTSTVFEVLLSLIPLKVFEYDSSLH